MRGRAKAKQAHALARFNASDPQAAKANDASTEERCGVQIIEGRGKRDDKVGASESVFRVSARDVIAGERGRVAEILEAFFAIRTRAVSSAEPRDADTRVQR